MITVEEEKMSDEFRKFHLLGLPFDAVIHCFTEPDKGDPHDHPFCFRTFILRGSYIERRYEVYRAITEKLEVRQLDILRKEGTTHVVYAEDIHEIITLPDGDCYTLIIPEPKEREPGFWRFNEQGIWCRQWNEPEFKLL